MHPAIYLVAQFASSVLIVGFSTPNAKTLRLCGLAFNVLCIAKCLPLCMPYMVRTPWAALVGGYLVTYLYHYLDIGILSRWSFAARGPTSGLVKSAGNNHRKEKKERAKTESAEGKQPSGQHGRAESVWSKLLFGLSVTSSFRFIGTQYQVPGVPLPAAKTKRAFLVRTWGVLLLSYVVLDFISSQNDAGVAAKFLGKANVPLFARWKEVEWEEIVVRAFTVLASGIGLNCVQGGIYHLIGLFAVSFEISEPEEWPPFYGSPGEAWTLRRFWNVFWHQTNARKFSSIAQFVTHRCLGLRRGTTLARYVRVAAAFLASGAMHLSIDIASGITVRDSGAMRFFLGQAVGLVLEDCVVRLLDQGLAKRLVSKVPGALRKSVGFLWVAMFLTWTVPAYVYPMMYRTNQGLDDSTIPFSLFGSGDERTRAVGVMMVIGVVSGTAVLARGE